MSTAISSTLRPDRRAPEQLREITVEYDGLDRVDGSARFGFGETKCLASVSGPIEVRLHSELPSQATLDVHIRPLTSIPGTDSKALAATLKAILTPALILTQHPRALVQIVAQALCGNSAGKGTGSAGKGFYASLVASLVNASTAALINAGSVPMRGVVCAAAVGRLADAEGGATLVLDPSEAELPRLSGGGCFVFLFSSALPLPADSSELPPCSLLWTNYTTSVAFDEAEVYRAQELTQKGAAAIWKTFKESIPRMGTLPTSMTARNRERKNTAQVKAERSPDDDGSDADDEKMEI